MTDSASSKPADLSDIEKSAVLLMSIGQDAAAQIVKSLSQLEINQLAVAMARMSDVPREVAQSVLREFVDTLTQDGIAGLDAKEYLHGVLDKALGPERAGRLVERMKLGDYSAGLDAMQSHDPRALADLIRAEHPQIIAMIFAYLDPEQVQGMIQYLPDDVVEQVIPRLAMLDTIPPAALRELNESLEQLLSGDVGRAPVAIGGVDAAAKILNRMGNSRAQRVLQVIGEIDADVAQTLADRMFVFEDLVSVDDRNFQVLLRAVDQKLWVAALKGASSALQDKVLRNMSQRAGEMLREEAEARGPMRLAEVEAARKEILTTAMGLEREGKVILRSAPGDLVA
ncbi:MAG TPA: flagellar motor switch protein FliG [Stellaceae bacterium]|nr:flagellar motor switch protein FliG [Stellaceae bacterium]